jgi:hypothetical protein
MPNCFAGDRVKIQILPAGAWSMSQYAARGGPFLAFKVGLARQGSLNYWACLGSYFASVPKEGRPWGHLPRASPFTLQDLTSLKLCRKVALLTTSLHHFHAVTDCRY